MSNVQQVELPLTPRVEVKPDIGHHTDLARSCVEKLECIGMKVIAAFA